MPLRSWRLPQNSYVPACQSKATQDTPKERGLTAPTGAQKAVAVRV